MSADVVGVVLAGGRSRRMGRDKALLPVDGTAMIERAARQLEPLCSRVIVAAGDGQRYAGLPWEQVADARPDCGPLAGLEVALAASDPLPALVLACDLPRVDEAVLDRLKPHAQSAATADRPSAWVPRRDGRLQPLCALYSASCGALFSRRLDREEPAVHAALEHLELSVIDCDDLAPDPFLNVNTPVDYASVAGQDASG